MGVPLLPAGALLLSRTAVLVAKHYVFGGGGRASLSLLVRPVPGTCLQTSLIALWLLGWRSGIADLEGLNPPAAPPPREASSLPPALSLFPLASWLPVGLVVLFSF